MKYKSIMVWSDSTLTGKITSQHVTSMVQPVLDKMSEDDWLLHSQSTFWAQPVGIHLIFYKQ